MSFSYPNPIRLGDRTGRPGGAAVSALLLWLPLIALVASSRERPVIILGSSMEPTLHSGQLALLGRGYYRTHPIERGDVVVFRWKGDTYVKRVYALGGEQVKMVCIQGYCMPLSPELAPKAARLGRRFPRFQLRRLRVPPRSVFVVGDCRSASIDSRSLGPIPAAAILGRVQSLSGSPLPERPAF
jgi:signal peptidase I